MLSQDFKNFIIFTALGSFVWSAILALLGYWFGANKELLMAHYHEVGVVFILIFVFAVGWFYIKGRRNE